MCKRQTLQTLQRRVTCASAGRPRLDRIPPLWPSDGNFLTKVRLHTTEPIQSTDATAATPVGGPAIHASRGLFSFSWIYDEGTLLQLASNHEHHKKLYFSNLSWRGVWGRNGALVFRRFTRSL